MCIPVYILYAHQTVMFRIMNSLMYPDTRVATGQTAISPPFLSVMSLAGEIGCGEVPLTELHLWLNSYHSFLLFLPEKNAAWKFCSKLYILPCQRTANQ